MLTTAGPLGFKAGLAEEIVQHRIGSATLVVLRCSVLSDPSIRLEKTDETLQVLLDDLQDFGRESAPENSGVMEQH